MKSLYFLIFLCSCSLLQSPYIPCKFDKSKQEARSKELAQIVKADQDARIDFYKMPLEEMQLMAKQDDIRRQRIGQIFGEGCFSTAENFATAALVFCSTWGQG